MIDTVLSEAQQLLREGHHFDLAFAIAQARDCLNTPIRLRFLCGCELVLSVGPDTGPPVIEPGHETGGCALSGMSVVLGDQ